MSNESEIKNKIREWLATTNGNIKAEEITDDMPIIEKKIISSMETMDLILELESMMDGDMDTSKLKPGVFKSLNTIYTNFF